MSFYIRIQKVSDQAAAALYTFECDPEHRGVFELDKRTNEVTLLEPMLGDEQQSCFKRASMKIQREWRDGRLPDVSEWAS
ncbi:hypothetical protein [Caenimonas koreensis]|uniref:hypothetical protein n=1 Tax=Caenimonas koreensis TaxID=367474 RepID=UPI0037841332